MTIRTLQTIIPSVATSDGAGVKLKRSLGGGERLRHDPFLMLDEFFSDNADDYIRGFPPHPHRGFETVTYMLDGHMRHEDNMGHRGDLGPGDVQWMTAGRGIIHSEMPQQSEGRLRGFQLWINLPSAEKMKPAAYRDIASSEIPTLSLTEGGEVRVIAGNFIRGEQLVSGPIQGLTTEPLYLDVHLPGGADFIAPISCGLHAFLYVYDGETTIGDDRQVLPNRAAGLLSDGDTVKVLAGLQGARFLLLAGKPLNEPIAQHGPFVMNTRAEIEQALADYRNGALT
ncbi:pirin family protein [Candidatus Methylospira mobilis]|uniref:Pirin family protein n=1 Tax=Candidatus Methylospira mobilis TaxID=1808979 RepID=A0A5Q0BL51_9GAMM|nr:pirin family protein [Candidatus Methylospira mobilis]QFY42496.1 pirin family protein [Candidatus Methylospira mobilis]WNV04396.1 pirin family protein [Candidatus Methylospira mobilis]